MVDESEFADKLGTEHKIQECIWAAEDKSIATDCEEKVCAS